VAEAQDLGLDDAAAALLRAEVGARQEDLADGDAAAGRSSCPVRGPAREEVLRDLDMDAGAVAGLAVGVDRAAVPDAFSARCPASTTSRRGLPSIAQTRPTPQASCSSAGS
jgi:hypothetical protein